MLAVPYSEEHIATCPVRAVEQLVRATYPVRAVGQRTHTRWIRQGQRVFVPNRIPLPPEKRAARQYEGLSRSAKPMSQILKCHTRKASEHSILYALLPVRRRGFTGVSRRLDVDQYAKNVLEKTANGLEVHASNGGSMPGHGRCQGRGYFREPVQGIRRIPQSELSRSWAAFANDPILEQEYKRAEVVRKTVDTNGIKSMGETMKTLISQTEV